MKTLSDIEVRKAMPGRNPDSYKGDYGQVLIIGGNKQMGGAIILSASAAVYSGAGLVTVATDPVNRSALHARLPEAMFLSYDDEEAMKEMIQSSDVILIGPGLGRDEKAKRRLECVLKNVSSKHRLVLDGDALTLLAIESFSLPLAFILLTPHLGEWEKLSGLSPAKENPVSNQKAVKKLKAGVVVKKHRTEIYLDGDIWQNTAGNAGMATGGMGDTLAGMLAGFLAQFDSTQAAVTSAVYLHSHIGDLLAKTQHVVLPSRLIEQIPQVMKQYERKELPHL